MRIWKILGLLVLFGVTLFPAAVLTVTAGIQNLVQFIVVWGVVVLASRAKALLAYLVSALMGVLLAFPASLFIYLPERGGVKWSTGDALAEQLGDPKTYIMVLIYVAAMSAAQWLLRSRMAPK